MRRVLVFALAAAALAGTPGCAASHARPPAADVHVALPAADRHVVVSAEKPPSPAAWPVYPHFSQHSCRGRPFGAALPIVDRVAPSYAPAPRAHPRPPAAVARRLLARFGDRRYVRSITFSAAPAAAGSNVHVLYAGGHPPTDALQATIVAPAANPSSESPHPSPTESLTFAIASWEAGLIGGALRDDLCSAGERRS